MRDFRIQAFVDSIKFVRSRKAPLLTFLNYAWQWVKPVTKKTPRVNTLYDLSEISTIRKEALNLGKFSSRWFPRIFEPYTLGIRAWEYGVLINRVRVRGKKILDVGVGGSRLPYYIASKGGKVTMLDMEQPLEQTDRVKGSNLNFVLGDMTEMSFKDKSFDVVLCISAIEHVDIKSPSSFYGQQEYIRRALASIREMARVTKKGGLVYLTTDFYLPEQKTDKWPASQDGIRGAFPWECVNLFAAEMNDSGLEFTTKLQVDKEILVKNANRANYRGRYFTTIAFLAKKL